MVFAALFLMPLLVYSLFRRDTPAPPEISLSPAVMVPPPAAESTSVKAEQDTLLPPAPPPVGRVPVSSRAPAKVVRSSEPRGTSPTVPPVDANAPSGAGDQEGARVLKRAAAAYANIRSLQADFAQWQENPLLGRRTNSRGTVFQRRPDRFLMRFSQPEGDVIVSDGEYFWIYYPSVDQKQVIRTRAAAAGGLDLQAQFIGDPTTRFSYTTHGSEQVNGRPAHVLTLVPKQDAGYKTLKVWIDQQDHLVRRFELTNENDVVQHFDLSNLRINPTLADALFRFTPPPGARIIER